MLTILLTALKDDDEKTFILNVYRDYYGLVRKHIFHITQDTGHLDDLINDTFIKLIEKISLLRTLESCKLAVYVVYTVRSVAINFVKHRDVENKHLFYGMEEDLAEELVGDGAVEDGIIREEELAELGNAITRLPEKQKDLLYFKYILKMDNEQLGEILGIAPASVRQYLTRSRRCLRRLIEEEVNQDGE
jgi:RNA polymerase sigma-70 factor (ECF subfamily)